MSERSQTYKKWWGQLVEMYGHHCYYCREEIATTIDHIVPYSWDGDNQLDNLVPACMLCNCIASNKMFDTLEQKRQYIMAQRKGRTSQRAICTDCLLPYTYLTHSPSCFLCAECYDIEYGTKNSKTREWKNWIVQLRAAGIPAEAHRQAKKQLHHLKDRAAKLEYLIDQYALVMDADDEFAQYLMV